MAESTDKPHDFGFRHISPIYPGGVSTKRVIANCNKGGGEGMTDEEKTQLRIRAAKALGKQEVSVIHVPDMSWEQLTDRFWNGRNGQVMIRDGQRKACKDFNPLTNAADCEALLVVTLMRGWRFDRGGIDTYFATSASFTLRSKTGIPKAGNSDNPDPILAYRESVTLACCAAWDAENTHQTAQEAKE